MMEAIKKNRGALRIIIIIILAFFGYRFLFPSEEPLTTTDVSSTAEVLGQDLLSELNRLKNLSRINQSIFVNPVFVNLQNTSAIITPRPVGRDNPFLPAGL